MISQMHVGVEALLAYSCIASSRLVFPTLFLPTRRLTRPRWSIFRTRKARKLRISSEFRIRLPIKRVSLQHPFSNVCVYSTIERKLIWHKAHSQLHNTCQAHCNARAISSAKLSEIFSLCSTR